MAGTSEPGTSRGTVNTPDGSAYDVFVSFRGPDTQYNITYFLYVFMREKGIRVFRDMEEVRHHEEIGDELLRAVPDSRIYVVVFSKGYASSAWCLRELAMMVDCCRDPASRKVILPIFYDVSPSDVKLQTIRYRDSLEKHKEKYNEEAVKMWEEALKKVGGIRGLEYKGDIGTAEFIRGVVSDILNKLNIKDPDHLVGMDDRVENVMGMLNLSSHVERHVVMVHGMGGIGKTALASVIFNRISFQFDGCCFLGHVREFLSTGVGSVERLQKELLKGIFRKSYGEIGDFSNGMNEIQRRLRNRRVLIIFDDVSESSQLKKLVGNFDFFGPGTIIIVTTRNKSVCEGLMRPSDTAYEMEGMSDDHALQLFSRHAFGRERPPNDFVDLSKRAIRMSGNLPLALEVNGQHLFGKDKNKWEHTLDRRVPPREVLDILRISCNDLDESEKQIFLDIACFDHKVMPRKYASYMWEACGFFPKIGLDVLQNRSLIKVLNVDDDFEDKYWMHDLIREMGREIVSSEKPGNRSRLWNPELALNVIRRKQVTRRVLAIDLRGSYKLLTGDEFEGMSNLRFLNLKDGAGLSGKFRNFPTNLLWLCLDVKSYLRPNPSFFHMDNLAVLQISGDGITDDSMKDMRMGNLKVLDISEAEITRLSDLSRFPKLEIIHLYFCWRLEEIHSSIGVLGYLKRLNIRDCNNLTRLPEELGSAKALQELSLSRCVGISKLPESIGRLGDLRILRGIDTRIRKLPSSIGNLKSLEVLEITRLPISVRIPMSKMPNLSRWNLSGLTSLRSLTLIGLDEDLEDSEVSDIMEESDEEPFADLDLALIEMQLATRNHIIGVDHQVLGLIESANRGIDGVLMIGICHTTKTCQGSSPRGVGSTTLAKAVYSRVSSQFDACCFLEDIAEAIAPPGGIRPLQFKLIHDILGVEYEDDTSFEDAFEVFKEVLHQMKVLIVLDGVEDVSHITNFIGKELKSCLGLGSWIIVTSRGNNVITESLGADLVIYKSVNLMETKVAVELFNWHAFGKEYCETECSEFVEPIVSKLLGCPLLIEFVGLLLHGEDVQAFEQLSKLQLTSDFWKVLAVLHGELDERQKQIFLDVACFASNEDVQTAKYMWHEWLSRYSGKTLMAFAKVGADDRLWIHSSLRRFGRELMDEKTNSGISSHVYDHQSAMDILKNERGTEKIEALCLGFDDKTYEEFTEKDFHKMSELRFLRLDSAVITGDFRGVFQKLRWLQWRRCRRDFEATDVDTKDLLILDLSGSAITEDWKGWENITLINVKVLNLLGCADLLLTPDFTKSPELERLILEGCARLVHIDPSIGTLKHLVYLNLKSCQELNILPQELGELVHLRELLIDGTGVEKIPDIGKLINLEILSCLGCIQLRCLPDSVGKLERLQKLSIRDCQKVQQLPKSIGKVKDSSLVELDISGTGIAELKNTISKLQSLKVLRMDSCFISELPSNIEHLTSLEELHASRCRNLKKIPPQIGELKNLRILELRHASISALPVEVSKLDKLEMLDISHCDKLEQPPQLPLKVVCIWSQN